jgi:hypothetical protein
LLRWHLTRFLLGMASNYDPPNVCLPRNWFLLGFHCGCRTSSV